MVVIAKAVQKIGGKDWRDSRGCRSCCGRSMVLSIQDVDALLFFCPRVPAKLRIRADRWEVGARIGMNLRSVSRKGLGIR